MSTLCVTLNPCVDRTIFVEKLELDKIISGRRSKCIPGGKGNNVARVLRTLGVRADSFVLLGGHTGALVESMIRTQDGITPIVFWTQSPTREVVTVVEERTHRQVAFKEPGAEVTPSEHEDLMVMLMSLIKQYEWVIFSGSVPCARLDDIYFHLIEAVRQNGSKAVLDSSGKALVNGLRAGPFMLKLNLEEAAYVLGCDLHSEGEIWRAVSRLGEGKASSTAHLVALTVGRQGAYVVYNSERWRAIPPPVETVNPVGSGDSFLAGMVAGLARGQSVEDSLRLAMAAGAANAAVWDAATFTLADVRKLLPHVKIQRM